MTDYRKDEISVEQISDSLVHIRKGDLVLCKVMNSSEFKQILAGNFDQKTGFTGDTLIQIGVIVNNLQRNVDNTGNAS